MIVLPPEMAHYLGAKPFDALMNMQGKIYRKQPLRETSRVYIQDKPYFLKKHFGISINEFIKNIFVGRMPVFGAKLEWKAIQALHRLNIPTTPLVGYGKRGLWPLTQKSFVLTKALDDCISLDHLWADWLEHPPSMKEKRDVIREIARIVRTLHTNDWFHRDLYLCHFLRDSHQKIHLIDLHRMIHPKFSKQRWLVKDLAALLFSTLDLGLTRADFCEFMTAYIQLPLRIIFQRYGKLIEQIIKRANGLYQHAHHDYPPQSWVNEAIVRLPRKIGPFHQAFQMEEGRFESERVLRVLDRRRWVIKGIWEGKDAVIKIFSRESDYEHELLCSPILREHAILSPAMYHHGKYKDLFLIIYAYIDQAIPIESVTPNLMQTMAALHENNMIQTDCHRSNFLHREDRIYVLDAGGLAFFSKPDISVALNNLALLFAQWPSIQDAEHLPMLAYYCHARGWIFDDLIRVRFERALKKVRIIARNKWLKKIFRNCTLIRMKHRLTKRYCIYRDFESLYTKTLLSYPESYFHPQAEYLKQGNSATVVHVSIGDNDVVIKRFNRKNLWVKLKRALTPSKAAKAWKMSHALLSIGIHVPQPLAFIEKRFGPFRLDSYYVCEFVKGERLDHLDSLEPCGNALNQMMENLNQALCQHGDLKASNILWDGEKLILLDTDGAKFYKNPAAFKPAHETDWARLLRNWEKQ